MNIFLASIIFLIFFADKKKSSQLNACPTFQHSLIQFSLSLARTFCSQTTRRVKYKRKSAINNKKKNVVKKIHNVLNSLSTEKKLKRTENHKNCSTAAAVCAEYFFIEYFTIIKKKFVCVFKEAKESAVAQKKLL